MAINSQAVEYIRWFGQTGIDDIHAVGGKNASLGEMYCELTSQGVKIPNGFATTTDGYRLFLEETGLDQEIPRILAGVDTADIEDLRQRGAKVRHTILEAELPRPFRLAIMEAYAALCREQGATVEVAVRSSATAEDLPDASFAGQQETYLNVRGPSQLLHACHRCFASLFTDRAISYREDQGFSQFKTAISVGVQLMVRSDVGSAGVMFSIDTESGFREAVLINSAYGLGENVVQGVVNPDEFYVFKPTLKQGFRPVLKKVLGSKESKLVYDTGGNRMTKNIQVPQSEREQFSLGDNDILALARWACIIEDHYTSKRGHSCPMDMEWAKDGLTGELFIVQARPETVQSQKQVTQLDRYELEQRSAQLVAGRAVGDRIGSGKVRLIESVQQLHEFEPGEVLVTDKTDPDWEPVMKNAAAIVTNRGGRTCHAAIVSRELGLPAIVGTNNATDILQAGQEVTVCCAEGDTGVVYEGALQFDIKSVDLEALPRPQTKVMLNVGAPDEAFGMSFLPNDGVGLAREEFIISTSVKVHPLALLDYTQLDPPLQREIDAIANGYKDKPQYFVDKLAEGVAMIAAAFYPKPVIVRMSDFKTNEYANLVGGKAYEPTEANPMIGFRGASRYYDPRYSRGFALECKAMKKVRDDMGLSNLKLMIPFCRTLEEGRKVIAELAKHGLVQGLNGLEVYVMCEIPSNVILAEGFAEIFDGFSIGSNDLTQLVLGVDRDSEIIAHLFDERDPAVKRMIAEVIRAAQAKGAKIGICGQGPSDFPEFAEFLVEHGIDSISLTPDVMLKTTATILEAEQRVQNDGDEK